MYLLINGQSLQSDSGLRGIGRYGRNLVAALAAARPAWRIELVESAALKPMDRGLIPGVAVQTFRPPFPVRPAHAEANECYLGDWLTARGPDVLLELSFFESAHAVVVPRFTGARPPLVGVLYDLIPLLLRGEYLRPPGGFEYARRFRQLLAADGLLAISAAAAEDLRRLVRPPRPWTATVGGAPDPLFAPPAPAELEMYRRRLRERLGLERPFLLCLGASDSRKNVAGAMRAFARLPEATRRPFDLIVAGKLGEAPRLEVEREAERLGLTGAVKLAGFVSDAELRALYQLCRVFVFASFYEGLGLPVLEALRCGAPVVASNQSSVPEVAGTVSWQADPASPADLAGALTRALAEPRAERLADRVAHANCFTWERTAALACRALETAAAGRPTARRRRRLAWVSPLPPAQTGVAFQSAELVRRLAAEYDIDLVVDARQPPVAPDLARDHTVLPAEAVLAGPDAGAYDLFVYQVADDPAHAYLRPLLALHPGLVVLHDFVPDRLTRAAGVLVHSAWMERRVRQATSAPVARVPFGATPPGPASRPQERLRLGLPAEAPVVCVLGVVESAERPAAVLHALAALPESLRRSSRLLFVGAVAAGVRTELATLARRLGVAESVTWTGWVPFEEMTAHARAADVCLHLGSGPAGDSSVLLSQVLGAGTACVVPDEGPFAELPDGVAWKVRPGARTVEDLTAALTRLGEAPAARRALGDAARAHVLACHDPEDVARQYAALIELTAAGRQARDAAWSERAGRALAAGSDPAAAARLVPEWARLRRRGQERLRERQANGVEGQAPCSGAA